MPLTEFTSWTPDHAYVGTFNITNASTGNDWKFIVHDTESGIVYKLYSISEASVKATNTSTTNVVLTASGLPDGQYYILQMIPNIEVTQHDPNNVSSNVEFVLSESTPATDISYVLKNVTSGNTYKIYDPSTLAIYGSGSVIGSNATINVTGLQDGRYRIAETGSERILFTYWDSSNASCNGIFQIWNSTPVTNVRLILHDVVMGERYSIFNYETNVIKGAATAYNNATIDIFGLPDGIYYISMGSGSQTTSIVKSTYVIGSVVVTTLVTGSLLYRRRKHD